MSASGAVRRFIEADGVGIAVHFDAEPSAEAVGAFEDLCRWLAANPERIRAVIPNAATYKLSEAEAAESGDRQLERIERLRRRAAGPYLTCAACGHDAYRPDTVTGRRQALRCMGCHRICGGCRCPELGRP